MARKGPRRLEEDIMGKTVEFYYDVGSPWSYLGYTQLPALAARSGAEIVLRPMLIGGVFKATGNRSPMEVPPKFAHMLVDLERYAAHWGVPFRMNPHFPINTITLMRAAVAADRAGILQAYTDAVFPAVWAAGEAMGDRAVAAQVLTDAGLDAEGLLAAADDPAVKEELKAATEAAVQRGIFGAPTYIVGGDLFFGQDRLLFVEKALAD
jgi:2-hydroxychromene-2-carboxylate isomerase